MFLCSLSGRHVGGGGVLMHVCYPARALMHVLSYVQPGTPGRRAGPVKVLGGSITSQQF